MVSRKGGLMVSGGLTSCKQDRRQGFTSQSFRAARRICSVAWALKPGSASTWARLKACARATNASRQTTHSWRFFLSGMLSRMSVATSPLSTHRRINSHQGISNPFFEDRRQRIHSVRGIAVAIACLTPSAPSSWSKGTRRSWRCNTKECLINSKF